MELLRTRDHSFSPEPSHCKKNRMYACHPLSAQGRDGRSPHVIGQGSQSRLCYRSFARCGNKRGNRPSVSVRVFGSQPSFTVDVIVLCSLTAVFTASVWAGLRVLLPGVDRVTRSPAGCRTCPVTSTALGDPGASSLDLPGDIDCFGRSFWGPLPGPARWHRLLWAILLGTSSLELMFVGGIKALQATSVVLDFPVMILIGFACRATVKTIREP